MCCIVLFFVYLCVVKVQKSRKPGVSDKTKNFNHKNISHEHAIIKHPFFSGSYQQPVSSS